MRCVHRCARNLTQHCLLAQAYTKPGVWLGFLLGKELDLMLHHWLWNGAKRPMVQVHIALLQVEVVPQAMPILKRHCHSVSSKHKQTLPMTARTGQL